MWVFRQKQQKSEKKCKKVKNICTSIDSNAFFYVMSLENPLMG